MMVVLRKVCNNMAKKKQKAKLCALCVDINGFFLFSNIQNLTINLSLSVIVEALFGKAVRMASPYIDKVIVNYHNKKK